MNPYLLVAVGVLYVGIAAQYAYNKQYGMALAFAGYAAAQIGFIMEIK
jgi:uncharacterized protein (UPF0333 family)